MEEISAENQEKIAALEAENVKIKEGFDAYYVVIGRNYYERPDGSEAAIQEAVDRLDGLKREIHENEKSILKLKGFRLCPCCESIVEEGAMFCGECGTRMEEIPEADEDTVICSRCGARNEKGKKFCGTCGQRLETADAAAESVAATVEAEPEKAVAVGLQAAVPAEMTEVQPEEAAAQKSVTEPEVSPETAATAEKAAPEAEAVKADRPEKIFCPNCGTQLPGDALFCGECGYRIEV